MKETEKSGENIRVFVRVKPLIVQPDAGRSKSAKQLFVSSQPGQGLIASEYIGKSPLISRGLELEEKPEEESSLIEEVKETGECFESFLAKESEAKEEMDECREDENNTQELERFSEIIQENPRAPFLSKNDLERSQSSAPKAREDSNYLEEDSGTRSLLGQVENTNDQYFFKMGPRHLLNSKSKEKIEFSAVFDPSDDNLSIFDHAFRDHIPSLLQGVNLAVFMYGQTNSGKTFTMRGAFDEGRSMRSQSQNQSKNKPSPSLIEKSPGILQLSFKALFEALSKDESIISRVTLSYVEIYNEKIYDLLSEGTIPVDLRERDGVVQVNSREIVVNSEESAIKAWIEGERKRHFAATSLNHASSRSHVLVKLSLDVREKARPLNQRTASLLLADLAGSENASKNIADSSRFKEGTSINRSLLALTSLIAKMRQGVENLSFRESKLTRMLQNALGGNCRTLVVCTLNSEPKFYAESVSTLRFAVSVGAIKTTPKPVEINPAPAGPSPNEVALQSQVETLTVEVETSKQANVFLQKEIEQTKELLSHQEGEIRLTKHLLSNMESTNKELAFSNAELTKSLDQLRRPSFASVRKRRSIVAESHQEKYHPSTSRDGPLSGLISELKSRAAKLEAENKHLRLQILHTESGGLLSKGKQMQFGALEDFERSGKRLNISLSKEELVKANKELTRKVQKLEKKEEEGNEREARLKEVLERKNEQLHEIKKNLQKTGLAENASAQLASSTDIE